MKYLRKRTPLRGANVLITGAGSGIGALMAEGAALRGAKNVIIWDINAEAGEKTAERIRSHGCAAEAYRVDVRDAAAVTATARQVLDQYGAVDILINNAGIVTGKGFLDVTDDEVERTFDINVKAHYRTIREFLPTMKRRDQGLVVTIASAAGLIGDPRQADYSPSKYAAVGISESLRAELRHEGSHVGTLEVCPFYIATGMFEGVRSVNPMLPILEPEEVATAVLDAIESRRQRLVLPRFASSVLLLNAFPTPVKDALADLFGVTAAMDGFVGRPSR